MNYHTIYQGTMDIFNYRLKMVQYAIQFGVSKENSKGRWDTLGTIVLWNS